MSNKAGVFTNWPAADIARCHNDECSVRESCIRWITRDQKHARVFFCGEGGETCAAFVNDGSHTSKP